MFPPRNKAPLHKKRTPGVYSHCSVRKYGMRYRSGKLKPVKTDIYPDKTLINLLKKEFGKNDNSNVTVSSYNASASIPRTVPVWNPTGITK